MPTKLQDTTSNLKSLRTTIEYINLGYINPHTRLDIKNIENKRMEINI